MLDVEFEFSHIAVVVADSEKARKAYEAIGYKLSVKIEDPQQDALVQIMEKKGSPKVELVEPHKEDSVAGKVRGTLRAGAFTTAYRVRHLDNAIEALKKEGYFAISQPIPNAALGLRPSLYLFSEAAGMVELVESSSS